MNNHTGKILGQPLNGAMIFDTPEAFFNALLGPLQHDAHVATRRHHQFTARYARLRAMTREDIARSEPARLKLEAQIAAWRQRYT